MPILTPAGSPRPSRCSRPRLRCRGSKLGPDHPGTLTSRSALATAYEAAGRRAEAERLCRDQLASYRRIAKPDSPSLAGALAQLGHSLVKQGRWSDADPVLRECLAIREKAMPDDWLRFNAMSLLGRSLLGQAQYAEAEPLIIGGYEGMLSREAKIIAPSKFLLAEAAERVVRLYEGWGKPEQAAAWKARLGLANLPADVFAPP
jgi:eukaryotic-like serine/threonine-protein kinase